MSPICLNSFDIDRYHVFIGLSASMWVKESKVKEENQLTSAALILSGRET